MKINETDFPPELSDDRIILRKLTDEDKKAVFEIYSDEESSKLDDWVPFKTVEEAEALIAQSRKSFIDNSEFRFGIEDAARRSLVGSCGIFGFDEWNRKCMIFYQIHHNEHNKGYATDAVRLLVYFIFEKLHANRIEAFVTPGNTASVRVLEKNGFKNEGILREMEFYKDKFWDGISMGMIRKDYDELAACRNDSDKRDDPSE